MALLLKNARVIDPQVGLDEVCDVLVRDGVIVEVGHDLAIEKGVERDLSGKVLVPGLVDMHVHLRDPGQEYKEDIETGTRAAAHGGFTDICCMPNTNPIIDTGSVVEYVRTKAAEVGKCRVHVSGACTAGEKGEALSEMGDMVAHGAVMFTDDGRGVQDAGMMRRVMDYAVQFGKAVSSHCQDESLVGKGQMNEGAVSTRLGLLGWPAAGEEIQIARDIELSKLTGCHIHVQHLSSAHGLDLVRRGKEDGAPVTCEVTPHHMFLTEESIGDDYNTNFKVNPPLRTAEDAEAVIAGVVDGTVDCIVTDHAPHADHEKAREFELAPFGMTGIETSVGLVVGNLVNTGKITWQRMVELMSVNPRKILGIDRVAIEPGCRADFTIIDPELKWTVSVDGFESRSNNSGFIGWELTGRATDVYVGGYATMEDGKLTADPIHL
ncbi:MAG: dihydroorotase [Eggerthellaceae bacterium]|nr:dihydroorotase [Eggerthellaceae bacterium]